MENTHCCLQNQTNVYNCHKNKFLSYSTFMILNFLILSPKFIRIILQLFTKLDFFFHFPALCNNVAFQTHTIWDQHIYTQPGSDGRHYRRMVAGQHILIQNQGQQKSVAT